MLFLGIISWKDASRFNGGNVFKMGGFIFKWGGDTPWRASVLMGGSKKIVGSTYMHDIIFREYFRKLFWAAIPYA